VSKIESIARNRKEYLKRKDVVVLDSLMDLEPSSEMLAYARNKTSEAETLLKIRPLSLDTLNTSADAYDLGAKVYQNIEVLADGSDTPQIAAQINTELKNVEKLRAAFLQMHNSLDIERLGDSGFEVRRQRCLQKADRYYRSFELAGAAKYFGLLTQIYGTIASVQHQIDFKRSDITLVSARLMDLCYEEIETFENYPTWKQRLQHVHQKKDFLARYRQLQTLISKISENVLVEILDGGFAGQYNRCLQEITGAKDTVRKNLIDDARGLRQRITQASKSARQQDFFWKSKQI
jgi:hypothetical protein